MPLVQYAGTFPSLGETGSLSRYKSVLTTTLSNGPWAFNWITRYNKIPGSD